MTISIIAVRSRKAKAGPGADLVRLYVERAARYAPCDYAEQESEATLLSLLERMDRRTRPFLVLTHSRGKQLTSEEFAGALGDVRDRGVQQVVLAVGPADGWSEAALKRADLTVAFGRITLPHELAAVVLAEQVYRAMTILAGHPYHSGH